MQQASDRMERKMHIHTTESLRAQDGDMENDHYQLEDGEKYLLTKGEADWLMFVTNRYCIADHLLDNIEETEEGLVYTVDTIDMSNALREDQTDFKAVCLSDDTVLQSIFFYSNHN